MTPYGRNRAISGGALAVEVPVDNVTVEFTTFEQNEAVSTANISLLKGDDGDDIIAGSAETEASQALPWAPPPLPSPLTSPSMSSVPAPSAVLNSSGLEHDGGTTAKDDYGDARVAEWVAPAESCGEGGGGAACVRGSQGIKVGRWYGSAA